MDEKRYFTKFLKDSGYKEVIICVEDLDAARENWLTLVARKDVNLQNIRKKELL